MGVSLLAVAKSIYYHTFDELVFQEHSDIEVTGLDYLAFSSLQVRGTAWKRLRPLILTTAHGPHV